MYSCQLMYGEGKNMCDCFYKLVTLGFITNSIFNEANILVYLNVLLKDNFYTLYGKDLLMILWVCYNYSGFGDLLMILRVCYNYTKFGKLLPKLF